MRLARSLAGISARELDRLAKTAGGHSSLIESGEVGERVSAKTVKQLAEVLGVSLDWLVGGKGREPTEAEARTAVDEARSRASAGEPPESGPALPTDQDIDDAANH